jgi:hypothetical protein
MRAEGLEPSTQGLKVRLPPNEILDEIEGVQHLVQHSAFSDAEFEGVLDHRLNQLINIFWRADHAQRDELLRLAETLFQIKD